MITHSKNTSLNLASFFLPSSYGPPDVGVDASGTDLRCISRTDRTMRPQANTRYDSLDNCNREVDVERAQGPNPSLDSKFQNSPKPISVKENSDR